MNGYRRMLVNRGMILGSGERWEWIVALGVTCFRMSWFVVCFMLCSGNDCLCGANVRRDSELIETKSKVDAGVRIKEEMILNERQFVLILGRIDLGGSPQWMPGESRDRAVLETQGFQMSHFAVERWCLDVLALLGGRLRLFALSLTAIIEIMKSGDSEL
jgi:hypothetical protein